jgi:hypothetical protein
MSNNDIRVLTNETSVYNGNSDSHPSTCDSIALAEGTLPVPHGGIIREHRDDGNAESPDQSQHTSVVRPKLSLQHPDDIPCDSQPNHGASDSLTDKKKQSHYYRNREKILAAAKLRYQKNRETLLAYSKQYQRERKDQVKDRNSAYYEKHRDRLLKDRAIKIECACGKSITKGSLASHLKTKYHLKRVEQDETVNIQTQSTAERTAEAVLV